MDVVTVVLKEERTDRTGTGSSDTVTPTMTSGRLTINVAWRHTQNVTMKNTRGERLLHLNAQLVNSVAQMVNASTATGDATNKRIAMMVQMNSTAGKNVLLTSSNVEVTVHAYPRTGVVMVAKIVWMAPTRPIVKSKISVHPTPMCVEMTDACNVKTRRVVTSASVKMDTDLMSKIRLVLM